MTKNKDEEEYIKEQEKLEDHEIHDKKLLEAEYDVASDNDKKAFEEKEEPDIKLSEIILISREGKFYTCFALLDSIASILSSYFYSWLACYGNHFDTKSISLYVLLVEVFFLVNMIVKFLTDYTEEGEKFPVRDLLKIMKRYLKNGFMIDLIPLIPL